MVADSGLYLYTENNPLNFKDEFGLFRKQCNECEELEFHTSYFITCITKPGAIIGATEVLACLACVGKVALPVPEWMSCTVCVLATAAQVAAILDCVDKARWCEPKK